MSTLAPSLSSVTDSVTSSSCCSCTWKELALLTTAVVGVALSIFVESIFGVIGFALLGLDVTLNYFEKKQSVSQLEFQFKQTLQSEEKKLTATVEEMEKQAHQLEENKKQFSELTNQFAKEEMRWQELQQGLTLQDDRLTHENQQLGAAKAKLELGLNETQDNLKKIRTEIQGFAADNIRLGEENGLFARNLAALDITKQQLQNEMANFTQEFDGDAAKLMDQIKLVKASTAQIIGALAKEKEGMDKDLLALKEETEQRRTIEENLRKELNESKARNEEFEKKAAQMQTMISDLKAQEAQFTELGMKTLGNQNQFKETIASSIESLNQKSLALNEQEKKVQETLHLIEEKEELLSKIKEELAIPK